MAAGPDFLCVGMPKAGTQWLFDQLQSHPDFWMPPIKEIYYLDRKLPRLKGARRLLKKIENSPERMERRSSKRRPWDARDRAFLEAAARIAGQPMDLERYGELFACKGDSKTGDITPNYCRLPDEVVAALAGRLPELRVVLLVRDPVARAWSHICMWHRQERFDETLLEDAARFRAFLEGNDHLLSISFATQTAARWRKHAPRTAFRHFFLDDIAARPEQVRGEILSFLGADPAKPARFAPDFNRKSDTAKLVLTESIKAVLIDRFAQELRDGASAFGGHAAEWPAKYGV
jgi:hypothetical protein